MNYDAIVIGCGIAGMTAGIYLARGNAKTLILDGNSYGGQIVEAECVENYPGFNNISGLELSKKLYEQVKSLGVDVKFENVLSLEDNQTIKTDSNIYKTKTIIIANGLVKRKLGLENENKFIGSGVSYCATCDGAFFKNRDVAIVGAGSRALSEALYLSKIVNKLYFIHRSDNIRGEKSLYDKLKGTDNVEFLLNKEIISLNGDNVLESITLNDNTNLNVNGLFISIGNIPNNEFLSNLIELDEKGYILSNDCSTNVDNIFVAGDTRTKDVRQLVTASSDGCIAAMKALECIGDYNE